MDDGVSILSLSHGLRRFLDGKGATSTHVSQLLNRSRRPTDFDEIRGRVLAQAKMYGASARRCVTGGGGHVVILRAACGHNLDASPDSIAVAGSTLQLDVDPVIIPRAVIDPDLRGRTEGADHHVQAAVTIEISHCRSA